MPSGNSQHGAQHNPPSRFLTTTVDDDWEQLCAEEQAEQADAARLAELVPDESASVVSENHSPDIPFRYSVNPYRGCEHGCAYCYARPTHEYFGLSAGVDFETRIFVKHRAAELLRDWLARRGAGEVIAMSGVTDCYQPAERHLQLTRRCLQVCLEARQPVVIITKNALVARDLDVLRELARRNLVHVRVSLSTLDAELARSMEPRTSTPLARLRAIRLLAGAGVSTGVLVAPIIPGLTDREIPSVLSAASEAGAQAAGYVMLRLPETVRDVFLTWLHARLPLAASRVEAHIKSTRGGKLNDSRFGSRMRGEGVLAEQIRDTFQMFAARHGLDRRLPELDTSQFCPPRDRHGQRRLF